MSTYDRVPDYANVNGKINGNADFILHCLKLAEIGEDPKFYLHMAQECVKKILAVNAESWKAYRKLNFDVEA